MSLKDAIKKSWDYLQQDTWDAWLISLVLIIIIIKFILFPLLSLATGTSLPLVVVESCSMYHESSFDSWWEKAGSWYTSRSISQTTFESFPLKNGLNKGDIVLVWGYSDYTLGDIIIFSAKTPYPIIHRIVTTDPISTKGDHNIAQLGSIEMNIPPENIIGKAVARVPFIGWAKLIFFDIYKPSSERGLCK
jgi:signal peptidase I